MTTVHLQLTQRSLMSGKHSWPWWVVVIQFKSIANTSQMKFLWLSSVHFPILLTLLFYSKSFFNLLTAERDLHSAALWENSTKLDFSVFWKLLLFFTYFISKLTKQTFFYIKYLTWPVAGKAGYFTITVNPGCIFCGYNFTGD